MVVDVRYHLASLVAVFFALGLGVLIGTTLSADKDGLAQRDHWLTALEAEFSSLRETVRDFDVALEQANAERDRYERFALSLVEATIADRLQGKRIAVAALDEEADTQDLEELLLKAGALVQRQVGGAAEIFGWLGRVVDGQGEGEERADGVVIVAAGSAADGLDWESLFDSEQWRGSPAVVVSRGADWLEQVRSGGLPYVTHDGSPFGMLSVVLLLAEGGAGGYGEEPESALWPSHLLTGEGH